MLLTLPQVIKLLSNLSHITVQLQCCLCLKHSPLRRLLVTEYCLMQRAALANNEAAALFLTTHGAKVNHINKWVRMNIWS